MSGELYHDRDDNLVNEIEDTDSDNDAIETTNGDDWHDPEYSARGNATSVPKPIDLENSYACTYDAWNRLAFVWVDSNSDGDHDAGETVIARYEYDGLGRRVKKHLNADADDDFDSFEHLYYNAGWQLIETRKTDSENGAPDSENPLFQYVWSARYIDAPVLRDENKDADGDCIDGNDERLYYTGDANIGTAGTEGPRERGIEASRAQGRLPTQGRSRGTAAWAGHPGDRVSAPAGPGRRRDNGNVSPRIPCSPKSRNHLGNAVELDRPIMIARSKLVGIACGAVVAMASFGGQASQAGQRRPLSHPAVRPLPRLSNRPMAATPAYYVDAAAGSDRNAGSKDRPWQTIRHALRQLRAGDTLYLRGGNYFENVYCAVAGTAEKPITIRGYPGQRAVIDGGIVEFQTAARTAWRPFAGGAPDEYVSTRRFRNIRDVVGAFGDSNIGLQTYWHAGDLRAKNELWISDRKTRALKYVYCGPGLWYDKQTGRIHIRLAHTHVNSAGVPNYTGETDPRKLPVVVAPFKSVPLFVDQAKHVRFQDLVIRGGGFNTVVLQFGIDVEFDNVTVFCGTYGLRARSTGPFKMVNSALHGMIPPWGFRNENCLFTYTPRYYDPFLKEPGTNARNVARLPTHALLVTEGSYEFEVFHYPYNHDWDIKNCDFTDAHDGVYLSGRKIRFHHNRVDHIQDDGIYLSSPVPNFSDDLFIYQNLITRCLMAFGCHSRGGPNGKIYIFRNIADLREGVNAGRPTPDNPAGRISSYHVFLMHGRGKPLGVESLYFYQNTFVSNAAPDAFAHRTLTKANNVTRRRVFNNIFVYLNRYGRLRPFNQTSPPDIHCDGNLHWCADPQAAAPEDYLEQIRHHPVSETNRRNYPPGWASRSIVADPRFRAFETRPGVAGDFRLRNNSPAIGGGVILPADLEDPLRPTDGSRPDIGALPHGAATLSAGRKM